MNVRNAILILVCIVVSSASALLGQEHLLGQYSVNVAIIADDSSTYPGTALHYPTANFSGPRKNQHPWNVGATQFRVSDDVSLSIPKDQVAGTYSSYLAGTLANMGGSMLAPGSFEPENVVWPVKGVNAYESLGVVGPIDEFAGITTNGAGSGYSNSGNGAGQGQGASAPLAEPLSTENDGNWHVAVSPYLWFPWIHGTVGAAGRDVGFSVTPSDLLSKAKFGLLGVVEARRNRIITNVDLLYLRLGADNALPFPGLEEATANLTANVVILTPKVGVRLIGTKKLKVDFLTGIRYWYFGESVSFSPVPGLNFSRSQNWVDPLVGGRIELGLSRKTVFTMAGDVGGWGTGSQLEYQVFGALGYKLKPNMTLQAGYRYLYVDYAKGGAADANLNLFMSGIVIGATLNLK